MSPFIHICLLICLLPNIVELTKSNSKLIQLGQIYTAREKREPDRVTADRGRERSGRERLGRERRGRERRAAERGTAAERIIRIMIEPPPPHQVRTLLEASLSFDISQLFVSGGDRGTQGKLVEGFFAAAPRGQQAEDSVEIKIN